MPEFTIEKGKNYSFLSKIDPRYISSLSDLLNMKFSTLEKLMLEVKKRCLDETKFHVPCKENLTASGEYPVFYQIKTKGLEFVRIRATFD